MSANLQILKYFHLIQLWCIGIINFPIYYYLVLITFYISFIVFPLLQYDLFENVYYSTLIFIILSLLCQKFLSKAPTLICL